MNDKNRKLSNPLRVAELSPAETLKKIGFNKNDVLCDIGAGTGVFTFPAALITGNFVYALDIDKDSLDIIKDTAYKENLTNIKTQLISGYPYELNAESMDLVLLCTVFHEIEAKENLLNEIRRVMKKGGKLAFIEFHKRQTPMGPSISHRISKEEVMQSALSMGFIKAEDFVLGENFYCIVFKK